MLSRLPIYGDRYEEYILSGELFRQHLSTDGSRCGEIILPVILPALLRHYQQAFRSVRSSTHLRYSHSHAILPLDTWIQSFLRADYLDQPRISLHDPFELGLMSDENLTEGFAELFEEIGHESPALPGINEQFFLVGFLVT